jgi:hypothetical protein
MEIENSPLPRMPLNVPVDFKKSYARQVSKATLRNISLSGAFMEFRENELKPSEKLVLTFMVSGRERKIQATVIWANTVGAGVKFKPTNNRDVQIIDDLMYFVEASRSNKRGVLDTILKKVA